jgi:hypothetical protein
MSTTDTSWTPEQEAVIARIMREENKDRIAAIQAMRRRKLG